MARFERRKIQNPTASQPVGNIYARNSVQRVVRPNVTQTNTSQEQIMNVLKKHDQLLNKLLTRFNDFEQNMKDMVLKTVEKKITEMDVSSNLNSIELLKKQNIILEEKVSNIEEAENTNANASEVVENDTNLHISGVKDLEEKIDSLMKQQEQTNEIIDKQNNKIDNIVETVDDIQQNMASVTFIDRNKLELNHELGEMFKSVEEKYQRFNESQSQKLTDWMNSFQYNMRTAEIVNEYEEQKDNLFYQDTKEEANYEEESINELENNEKCITDLEMEEINEEDKAMKELEKSIENKVEKKTEKKDIEIEVIKKNKEKNKVELEITEK
jgi:hypothetical protein